MFFMMLQEVSGKGELYHCNKVAQGEVKTIFLKRFK